MNATEVQKKIAAALSREEPLTSAECKALLVDAHGSIGEVGERIARLRPDDDNGRGKVGVEYQRALQTGTPEDVEKVEAEFKTASTLAAQLQAQRNELNHRLNGARLDEVRAGLPEMHKALADKVGAAEQAKARLKQALAEVSAAAQEIIQARMIVRVGTGHDPDGGATIETLRRLDALQSAFTMDATGPSHPRKWIDDLGCAVTRNVYMSACAKAPDVDFGACTNDEDVMRTTVLAVHGQERIDEINGDKDPAYKLRNAFEGILPPRRERLVA